uniref:Uncharacterized protein n=1 Tax=Tanacetum cinerariifolium TaxID=118510 RepID=A0A699K927_TANCI|nr:hypothetical protein [Tanacetum cinerariifolium]
MVDVGSYFVGKCVATNPDTSSCNLHDRSARRSKAQVKRGRDGAFGASTATKCSLALKRPCGILTDLLMSGGLDFGECYSLPTLSSCHTRKIRQQWKGNRG